MKIAKKLGKSIIAAVMCMLLVVTAWATEQIIVNYTAELNDNVICVNELSESKTVTLTAKAGETVEMDSFTAQVTVPEGLKITGIANEPLKFTEDKLNLENGMILWYSSDAENVSNDLFAQVTVEVPVGTPAGAYEIVFEIIDISRDWGMPWEDGQTLTATLTVAEHADGDDADHLCDTCGGEIDGVGCTYVPGEPVWSDDNMTVTVTGTCACGETATATADAEAVVIEGNCQTAGSTTYTATFTESWITEKTVTKVVEGEKDMNVHVGEQTTTHTNNGENHTVTVTCACGGEISSETVDHDFTDGDCVCGAVKPTEPEETEPVDPSEPDVTEGMLGDVDLDGDVDANDLTLLARHVGGIELLEGQALSNADVNGDGAIDANDLTKHARFVGGIITDWNEE